MPERHSLPVSLDFGIPIDRMNSSQGQQESTPKITDARVPLTKLILHGGPRDELDFSLWNAMQPMR